MNFLALKHLPAGRFAAFASILSHLSCPFESTIHVFQTEHHCPGRSGTRAPFSPRTAARKITSELIASENYVGAPVMEAQGSG